ncbi:MAG: hypothetical protein ABSB35_39555 [Bryobacteraceae bacterium]|jgi:hypothetical protein
MKPTNEHEKEIVRKVDQKARAIRGGVGAWDNAIITEMRISVGFEMSISDEQFLESYVSWRRRNPIYE